MFKFINTYVYLKISLTFKKPQIIFNVWFHSWLCIKFQLIQNIPKVLIGFMLCHTTSNLPPNCSNPAFFMRLLLSLVPSVQQKKGRWSEWPVVPTQSASLYRSTHNQNINTTVSNSLNECTQGRRKKKLLPLSM